MQTFLLPTSRRHHRRWPCCWYISRRPRRKTPLLLLLLWGRQWLLLLRRHPIPWPGRRRPHHRLRRCCSRCWYHRSLRSSSSSYASSVRRIHPLLQNATKPRSSNPKLPGAHLCTQPRPTQNPSFDQTLQKFRNYAVACRGRKNWCSCPSERACDFEQKQIKTKAHGVRSSGREWSEFCRAGGMERLETRDPLPGAAAVQTPLGTFYIP